MPLTSRQGLPSRHQVLRHVECGIRRGSVGTAGASPFNSVPDNFVPAVTEAEVFWQLLPRGSGCAIDQT
jgi:hypothetical protein